MSKSLVDILKENPKNLVEMPAAQPARGAGNTRAPRTRSRGWTITINNPIEADVKMWAQFDTIFDPNVLYIWALEGRNDEKTTHIQGYIYTKNPRDFTAIKKIFPRAHIEKAKGSKRNNYDYCSKEGLFWSNMLNAVSTTKEMAIRLVMENEYKDVIWKPWQQEILDLINGPVDPRKIYWYYEKTGNVGKSFLVKYIAMNYNIILGEGKMNDVFNQINLLMTDENEEKKGKLPNIILLDVPRCSFQYVNYALIEKTKNGCIYSGKYEGGVCIFPIPHVIIMANEPPRTYELSKDRLVIKLIE